MLSLNDKLSFIQRAFGPYRISRDGRNVDVRCPICAPSDRSKLKLSILTEDSDERCLGCHCWTCGYKSRTLWKLLVKFSSRELLFEYRDRFLPESMRRRSYDDDVGSKPAKLKLPKDFKLLVTAPVRDPDVLAIRRELLRRHVSERDMWFYKLGYSKESKWKRRIIVPSFDASGELNLYTGRTVDKHVRPRYEMPDGKRDHIIFNELNIDWGRQIVLCEGPFDAMKCGDNAVPMLGSDLNEETALFNAIVANKTPVALAMDADMRTTKMPKVAKKLASYDVEVTIVHVPDDPGAMTKQEFQAALGAAKPLDWRQAFLDKLESASRVSL